MIDVLYAISTFPSPNKFIIWAGDLNFRITEKHTDQLTNFINIFKLNDIHEFNQIMQNELYMALFIKLNKIFDIFELSGIYGPTCKTIYRDKYKCNDIYKDKNKVNLLKNIDYDCINNDASCQCKKCSDGTCSVCSSSLKCYA
jgi:hypothetical protein